MALRLFIYMPKRVWHNNSNNINKSRNFIDNFLSVNLIHYRVRNYFGTFFSHRVNMSTNALPEKTELHTPVMSEEVSKIFANSENGVFLDMTFGAGGHTKMILQNNCNSKVLCLDRDPLAYHYAKELAEQYPGRVIPLFGKFSELPNLLNELGVSENSLDGILMDV